MIVIACFLSVRFRQTRFDTMSLDVCVHVCMCCTCYTFFNYPMQQSCWMHVSVTSNQNLVFFKPDKVSYAELLYVCVCVCMWPFNLSWPELPSHSYLSLSVSLSLSQSVNLPALSDDGLSLVIVKECLTTEIYVILARYRVCPENNPWQLLCEWITRFKHWHYKVALGWQLSSTFNLETNLCSLVICSAEFK